MFKSVEEGALEVGDLERARKQCFLYMHPKKHFSRPPGNPYFAIAGFYCFFLTLYLDVCGPLSVSPGTSTSQTGFSPQAVEADQEKRHFSSFSRFLFVSVL